jgi:hypothetical protein
MCYPFFEEWLLMPKNESPKIIKDPKLPKCDFLTQ